MYKRNIEARSRNHCCRGQAVSNKYCVCVCVCVLALVILHANRIFSASYYTVISGLSDCTNFFQIIS
jgi:hypothetical protein